MVDSRYESNWSFTNRNTIELYSEVVRGGLHREALISGHTFPTADSPVDDEIST